MKGPRVGQSAESYRFKLATCFKIGSPITHEVWVVPDCFVHQNDQGIQFLQLRFSVSGLCKLFVERFRMPLTSSAGVQLLLQKRNDAAAGLQQKSKDKSIFDDSDDDKGPQEDQQKAEEGTMRVQLSDDAVVVLQIPKRRDSEVRVKLEEENVATLFEWLSQQDLAPQPPPKSKEKAKARKRKAVEAAGESGEEEKVHDDLAVD